ncbi:MAG: hypothetical protein MUE41_03085 [Gemmatimonadaceae bacterium]|jgi:hypothetical protein|nr:hypothetical protein [Gemmatimonadaceae bacterium]
MALTLGADAPTLLIRRAAFERAGLDRAALDDALTLTAEEFRMEGALIAVGPLVGEDTSAQAIELLERAGLVYYDDFIEVPGNWPAWIRLYAMAAG